MDSTPQQPVPPVSTHASSHVARLAARIPLRKELSYLQFLALSVATVAPFLGIFALYSQYASAVGSGILYLFLLTGIYAVCNATVFAHMSSLYPLAGGAYAVIHNVAGKFWGLFYLMLQVIYLLSAAAVVAGFSASFLNSLFPFLSVVPTTVALLLIILILALSNIRASGIVSGTFLCLELLFIAFWFVFALTHLQVPLTTAFTFPPHSLGDHGQLAGPVSFAVFITVFPLAVFGVSGYEWATHFTEEAKNYRQVRRALVTAALIGAIALGVGQTLITLVDAHFQAVETASVPGAYVLQQLLPALAPILIVYIAMSSFNAGLANYLQASRVVFEGARNGEYGSWVSGILAKVNRAGVPQWATVLWIIPSVLLVVFPTLQSLLAFTSVLLVVAYILVSLSAIIFYLKVGRSAGMRYGAFRFFPLFPAVVILFGIVILTTQSLIDLLISAGILLVGLILAVAVHRNPRLNSSSEIVQNSLMAGSDLLAAQAHLFGVNPEQPSEEVSH